MSDSESETSLLESDESQTGEMLTHKCHLCGKVNVATLQYTLFDSKALFLFSHYQEFKIERILSNHFKIHTRQLPFECEKCGKVIVVSMFIFVLRFV